MSTPLSKLGLGTVQFGLDYGVSNARGRTPSPEVPLILERAAAAGVGVIDTAPAYGDADVIVGQSLPRPCPFLVVTKVSSPADVDAAEHQARASLANLGLDQAYAVLVHSAADLEGQRGVELWARLRRLQAKGLFRKIGISAYASDDPVRLARRWKPDMMQLPVSLLDQRLVLEGALERLADMGVEIHLRSIFLQGLLFLPPERMPPELASAAPRLVQIRSQLALAGVHPLEAALHYALARPEASAVVAGVTGLLELEALLAAARAPAPDLDWSDLRLDDPFALDPHRWAASSQRAA
jgi:aryl-alcohol dehydrogenase-like predicted oxidoreductase